MDSFVESRSARLIETPATQHPKISILGGEGFTSLISAAGGGYCRTGDIAVNRWRIDPTRDDYGQWCYLRHLGTGVIWSAAHQPRCTPALEYQATLAPDCVTIRRRDEAFETRTEIVVVPGQRAESRRITIFNHGESDAEIELTSYQEVVLASLLADRGHRAFSNLFVQTEWLSDTNSILAMRRPRAAHMSPLWCGHTIAIGGTATQPTSCETDRAVFLGRGRSARNPVAMDNRGNLSGTVGAVLDPVMALRASLLIPAGDSANVIFTTFFAADEKDARDLARLYHDHVRAATAFESDTSQPANAGDQAIIDFSSFFELAEVIIYGPVRIPSGPRDPLDIPPTREELLEMGIAGDTPIVLMKLCSMDAMGCARDFLAVHDGLRQKHVDCELVILCTGDDVHVHDSVAGMLARPGDTPSLITREDRFVLRASTLTPRQVRLLEQVSRVELDCDKTMLRDLLHD